MRAVNEKKGDVRGVLFTKNCRSIQTYAFTNTKNEVLTDQNLLEMADKPDAQFGEERREEDPGYQIEQETKIAPHDVRG